MDKFAEYRHKGKAETLLGLGLPPRRVMSMLMSDGVTKEAANGITKEAIGGLVSGGLRALAGGIGRLAGRYGGRAMSAGAARGGRLGGAMQWGGKQMLGAGKATGQAVKGLRTAPMKTMGQGLLNTGKGALFLGGKGIGGTVGKGLFGASMLGNLSSPRGYSPQGPPGYGPQNYGGVPRQ